MKLRRLILWCFWLALVFASPAFAIDPVVSNVHASQRAGTKRMDVYYALAYADSSSLSVTVVVATNGGQHFAFEILQPSGAAQSETKAIKSAKQA